MRCIGPGLFIFIDEIYSICRDCFHFLGNFPRKHTVGLVNRYTIIERFYVRTNPIQYNYRSLAI
jgi:hypothetical protein